MNNDGLHCRVAKVRDIRQTPEYAKYLKHIGWNVETVQGVNYFIKKFPLIGSVIKVQRPNHLDFGTINNLAKKYRAFQTIIEPKVSLEANVLKKLGYKQSKSPYLPTKTLQLDLTKSANSLISEMKKDSKKSIAYSSEIKIISDTELFLKNWHKAVGIKRSIPNYANLRALKKSFGKSAVLLSDQKGCAGGIFLIGDKIGYYWQAFTNSEGRKDLSQYKIVWEGVLWAKKRSAKVFDFEGIYDDRFPNKKWLGFTHFKKSFGGYEVEYPGTFVKRSLTARIGL